MSNNDNKSDSEREIEIDKLPKELVDLTNLTGVREARVSSLQAAGYECIPDIHHSPKKKIVKNVDGVRWKNVNGLKESASILCNEHFEEYNSTPFMQSHRNNSENTSRFTEGLIDTIRKASPEYSLTSHIGSDGNKYMMIQIFDGKPNQEAAEKFVSMVSGLEEPNQED